jgi:hypothetical protein
MGEAPHLSPVVGPAEGRRWGEAKGWVRTQNLRPVSAPLNTQVAGSGRLTAASGPTGPEQWDLVEAVGGEMAYAVVSCGREPVRQPRKR